MHALHTYMYISTYVNRPSQSIRSLIRWTFPAIQVQQEWNSAAPRVQTALHELFNFYVQHFNGIRLYFLHFFYGVTAPSGPGPPHVIGVSRSHSNTPHSVRLLWTSDQPEAETSSWQHTTLTTDRHPCTRRDSNLQCQQVGGHRQTF